MTGAPSRSKRWLAHLAVRMITAAHHGLLALPRRPPRRAVGTEPVRFLLTGTFHSEAWLTAHLAPLAASPLCGRVVVVANDPVPSLPKVEWVRPARPLVRVLGRTAARFTSFARESLRGRPHVVGGFHLLLNGLLAIAVARLTGARSLLFNVGGTAEVDEGGRHGENRLFGLMSGPDPVVEQRLLRAVGACDVVVTMGRGAAESLRRRGVRTSIHVIGGGLDPERFAPGPSGNVPDFDLVLVGRLAPVKRVDLFLEAVTLVAARRPETRAVVVGDGPLRPALEAQARELGLQGVVLFAGRQTDVASWLRRSRVFVLTSDSEGLPLSAIEAMMCGLPVVAPAVGDLAELVEDGTTGNLVRERQPEAFVEPLLKLLTDEAWRRRAAQAATVRAGYYTVENASRLWDSLLAELRAAQGELS